MNALEFLCRLHRSGCVIAVNGCSFRLGDEVVVSNDGKRYRASVIDCDRDLVRLGWGEWDEIKEEDSIPASARPGPAYILTLEDSSDSFVMGGAIGGGRKPVEVAAK